MDAVATVPPVDSCDPCDRRDRALAAGVFALLLVVYGLTFQERFTGDGTLLSNRFYFHAGRDYPHVLYLPLCDLLARILPWPDPVGIPKLVSVVAGALGGALTYLVARGFGAGRGFSLAATGLLALSPAAWFFSTTTEVHALHWACVALAACAALYAPWKRPALALALVLATFPLGLLSHRSGAVLGLGWLLLMRRGRERVAEPFTWRTTLLLHGPVLLAWTLLWVSLANVWAAGEFVLQTAAQERFLAAFQDPPGAETMLRDGLLAPYALLLPVAAIGLFGRGTWMQRLAPVAIVLPAWAFFFHWGVSERGGYFLAGATFLAALAGRGLSGARGRYGSRWGFALCVLLVAAQAFLGWRTVARHDRGFRVEDRVAQVEHALSGRGVIVSFLDMAPKIEIWSPFIVEAQGSTWASTALAEGATPESFRDDAVAVIQRALDGGLPVGIDLSYTRVTDEPALAQRLPYIEAFVSEARLRWSTEEFEHEFWPILVLRR